MKRSLVVVLALLGLGALAGFYVLHKPAGHEAGQRLAALRQTLHTINGSEPVRLPLLVDTDGEVFAPRRLQQRWSVLFFGFASCGDVCPTTLQALGSVASDPASGVAAAATQILFVSIDPTRDTQHRLKAYLTHFSEHIVGLSGSAEATLRFSHDVGAAYAASGSGIDHSTSLFVLDPQGRVAAALLRPDDPARILADLKSVQASYVQGRHATLSR